MRIITARKRSCGKVMFSHISVNLFRGSPRNHYPWCIGTWVPLLSSPRYQIWALPLPHCCSLEDLPPPVLTSSGGHQNKYGWQVGCTHPTGMLSSYNSTFPRGVSQTIIWQNFPIFFFWKAHEKKGLRWGVGLMPSGRLEPSSMRNPGFLSKILHEKYLFLVWASTHYLANLSRTPTSMKKWVQSASPAH